MRAVARVVGAFLVAQAVASGVAWACKCDSALYDPVAERDANTHVFVGEVLEARRGCGGGRPVEVTLFVAEAFKGVEAGEQIELTTASDGAACGVDFQVGESWLVYTSDGRYGLCDPGGLAADHADDLEALRAEE